MNKNIIKAIVNESVKRVLKEGTTNKTTINNWEYAKEQLGAEEMLDSIMYYMSETQIQEMLKYLDQDYDLGFEVDDRFYESKRHNRRRVNEANDSKQTYRGVRGSEYVWHGGWSDPEVIYNGVSINYWDVEDSLWSWYKEECEENDENPTKTGFEKWVDSEKAESELYNLANA